MRGADVALPQVFEGRADNGVGLDAANEIVDPAVDSRVNGSAAGLDRVVG